MYFVGETEKKEKQESSEETKDEKESKDENEEKKEEKSDEKKGEKEDNSEDKEGEFNYLHVGDWKWRIRSVGSCFFIEVLYMFENCETKRKLVFSSFFPSLTLDNFFFISF